MPTLDGPWTVGPVPGDRSGGSKSWSVTRKWGCLIPEKETDHPTSSPCGRRTTDTKNVLPDCVSPTDEEGPGLGCPGVFHRVSCQSLRDYGLVDRFREENQKHAWRRTRPLEAGRLGTNRKPRIELTVKESLRKGLKG